MTSEIASALRSISKDGFIGFNIKAKNTDDNAGVHDGFKQFAKDECGNDYTLALKTLLVYYQEEAKFEALWEVVKQQQYRIDEVAQKLEDKQYKEDQGEKENAAF